MAHENINAFFIETLMQFYNLLLQQNFLTISVEHSPRRVRNQTDRLKKRQTTSGWRTHVANHIIKPLECRKILAQAHIANCRIQFLYFAESSTTWLGRLALWLGSAASSFSPLRTNTRFYWRNIASETGHKLAFVIVIIGHNLNVIFSINLSTACRRVAKRIPCLDPGQISACTISDLGFY